MIDQDALESIMPYAIPIVAIVMGIGIGMLALWIDYRKKREIFELHHRERMLAIERGMEVPPLPADLFGRSPERCRPKGSGLRSGLVLLLLGLSLAAALALNISLAAAAWGLIPAALGLANLIFYVSGAGRPQRPEQHEKTR